MIPGNLCNGLLHKFRVRVGFGELPHVFEVAGRETLDGGEGVAQVLGQPINDLGAPTLLFLAGQDVAPDAPVEQDQLAVGG